MSHETHSHEKHAVSDTANVFGRTITVPGGMYSVVLGVLAVITVIEVLLSEIPFPNVIKFPILAALSIGKAVLVVMFYMHLKDDSRIFLWAIGMPLAMAALIILFLLGMDPILYAGQLNP